MYLGRKAKENVGLSPLRSVLQLAGLSRAHETSSLGSPASIDPIVPQESASKKNVFVTWELKRERRVHSVLKSPKKVSFLHKNINL